MIAHKGDLDKKFDWDNLFLSCGHCNSTKNLDLFSENVINCTKVDQSKHIKHEFKDKLVVITPLDDDIESITTANLIEKCFDGENTNKRFWASSVRRDELTKEMVLFFRSLKSYKKNLADNEKYKAECTLKGLLKSDRKFAAFKRDYLRIHNSELLELLSK